MIFSVVMFYVLELCDLIVVHLDQLVHVLLDQVIDVNESEIKLLYQGCSK